MTQMDQVHESWNTRPCFICHRLGRCKHREPAVEFALIDVELRRSQQSMTQREPAAVTPIRRKRA